MNDNILCSVVVLNQTYKELKTMKNMENPIEKKINKMNDALTKELETLNDTDLHNLFLFCYKVNHQYYATIDSEKFVEFLESFKSNPFRKSDDKASRKELIENICKYANEPMSLLTAAMLLKRKFTLEEVIENFFSTYDFYGSENWV